jgi:acyl-CoA synthetase (NDP forming)
MSGPGVPALDALLRPRSIAILGASEDFSKINGRPLKFLLDKGYAGRIFPVNPKYAQLAGLPCFPAVAAIPEPVDLAIVALPATAVPDALAQCAAKRVQAAVVFSSGFGEMGEEGRALGAEATAALLAPYGVRFAPTRSARTAEEAVAAAGEIGYPVALKVESPTIQHKTEVGGVRLGVADADEARRAFGELVERTRRHRPDAQIDGVLVQRMVEGGVEVVVGLHQDPQFGPVVMAGLGGVLVEVLEDVAFRAAPITAAEAEAMLRELRGYRVLEGARGRPRADVPALVDLLVGVSRFAVDSAGVLAALDLNPVAVLPEGQGALAVDALAVLDEPGR